MKRINSYLLSFSIAALVNPFSTISAKEEPLVPATNKIIGGSDASSGEYPWMTAILDRTKPSNFDAAFCGGTLIHPYWVVTAAHCMTGETPQGLQVLVDTSDLSASATRIDVAEIIQHPGYNSFTSDNDIALIRLATPATNVMFFPQLADLADHTLPGTLATIIGWGSLNAAETQYPEILQEAEIPIVSLATALATTNYPAGSLTTNMVPAGFAAGGIDSCGGDSGGPLLVRDLETGNWVLAGVTSFGFGNCGDPGVYGIYALVRNYRDWILSYTQPGYHAWEIAENVRGEYRDSDNDGLDHAFEFWLNLSPHLNEASPIRASMPAMFSGSDHLAVALHRPQQHDGAQYFIGVATNLNQPFTYAPIEPLIVSATPTDPTSEEVFVATPLPANSSGGIEFIHLDVLPGTSLVIEDRILHYPSYVQHTLTLEDDEAGFRSKDYILTGYTPGQPLTITLRSTDFDSRFVLRNEDNGSVINNVGSDNAGGNDEMITFTPDGTTPYLIRVRSEPGTDFGNYQLAAYRINPALPTIGLPGSTLGAISLADPRDPNSPSEIYHYDDYILSLSGGIATVEVNMTSSDVDAYLYIINAETGEVEYEEDDYLGDTDARLVFSPQPGVPYYIRTTTFAAEKTGNYTLSTRVFEPLPTLTLPEIKSGTLSTSDPVDPFYADTFYYDDYRLVGVADGTQVTIKMTSSSFNTFLSIIDAATGLILTSNDNTDGTNAEVSFEVSDATNYFVRASSSTIAATGLYTLHVENTIPTPTLTVPQTDTGILTTSDRRDPNFTDTFFYDDYLITGLTADQSVTVRLRSTAFDTYLAVLDPADGSITLDNDNDDGTKSEASFTATADGSVQIRVSSANIAATGSYTIETRAFTPLPTINRPGTRSGALSISDKEVPNVTDRFYYDDTDLTGYTPGQGIRITLSSSSFDPYLSVLNATDNSVIYQQGYVGGAPASLHFTLDPGIEYRLRVSSGDPLDTGHYTLQTFTASPLPTITRPQTINGSITTGDQRDPSFPANTYYVDDYDLVNVPAGQLVTITLSSGSMDTYLYLLDDESRTVLAEDDDTVGTNARITFTTQANQRYVIRATTALENATGSYSLTVQ